eukprot:CAMPEP_0176496106 /NCGR_PEP_ID=MMETSP0200_2-20121128/11021_1 /TAXON_ID=947934 /ORGANISM="Chaetoceros sp., Strain GSL56" /LENGTH=768 /DNA_ID=CAMNT_0017894045 /DNA_START=676 /DNA_END=2978 /DNA_ORIENTATION=-
MKHITFSSAVLLTIAASVLSYFAGRATRTYTYRLHYNNKNNRIHDKDYQFQNDSFLPRTQPEMEVSKQPIIPMNPELPTPRLADGKKVPKTKYTSMVFSKVHVVSDKYSSLHLDDHVAPSRSDEGMEDTNVSDAALYSHQEVCVETSDGNAKCSINHDYFRQEQGDDFEAIFPSVDGTIGNQDESDEDEEEEHLPSGQHLLIDIKRVNSDFLNSEVRLAEAMLTVVNESKLTLLSYHCHKLIPMGVSCVGVLLESHISFHTWPEAGVITLDLFTCGNGELVPVLPVIERLFAVSMDGVSDDSDLALKPHTVWTHKLRGFRDVENHLSVDLGEMVLEVSSYELKKEIASVQSAFQRIDIYDTIHKSEQDIAAYERSLIPNGSYESKNPKLFEPNRLVFLDGILQSMREGNEAYHEALVHPAMMYHPDPKRVAIIGGGEGATLREVLKHDTVEKVIMIEIDEIMVNVSREFLPDWNDCSDLEGSANWCGDDERAEMKYVDAFAWFNDRFSTSSGMETAQHGEDPFDVIIMDALDPEDDIPFAAALYNNHDFTQTLFNALTDDGVLILQLGEAPDHDSPASQFTKAARRENLIDILVDIGFETIHMYEDGHCGFDGSWTYLLAVKDSSNDYRWYMTQPEMEVEIHSRIRRTKSGSSALKYFDGSIMQTYQVPHKVFEVVFCRTEPKPLSCVTDVARIDVPISDFEVKMSGVGDGSGRGVYTKVDIKQGSSIARKENARPIHIPASSLDLIEKYMDSSVDLTKAYGYIDGYG